MVGYKKWREACSDEACLKFIFVVVAQLLHFSLDLKSLTWIAPTQQSTITKQKWDSDRGDIEIYRAYLTTTCIEWLKKYVQYGSSTLERKVHPEVTLLQKDSGVACHATGFYPDQVMITWKRDGEEMQEDVDVGRLPNEDGTFQKRAVLAVSPEERKKGQYTCEVAHKGGTPILKTLIVEDGKNQHHRIQQLLMEHCIVTCCFGVSEFGIKIISVTLYAF
ncbi:major histocompatibility complex class I-related gene protein-like [Alosa alosa]|uniref:major histocompatibility complex class I-related gene protein-like n=1 Tax=Alosa alosa TaxID=278164 RepID=UPI002015181E|nr:major histocompatibility complex class I-related gene protein-like [Alosa alosa]